ncbi:hypothetical protein BKA70DRAFT_1272690 [Coprinopsis sp. MPI-PUGE-AT-0042]|nr:hypothetical protein BKA70DRAFT_1272690 [Coprinopsis sp. MPI-PUGE-AT-0042]
MSTQIDVISGIEFPSHWPPHGVDRLLSKRLDPVPYVRRISPPGSAFSVREKLYVGGGKWSQVYCGVMSNGGTVLDNVVLKVFDETRFPKQDEDEDEDEEDFAVSRLPSGKPSFRYTGEIMAWQESWAYGALKSMQGVSIPRFHGVYQIRFRRPRSKNPPLFAALMSYADGVSLVDQCRKVRAKSGDQAWFPLARQVYNTLFEINQLGVSIDDLRAQNLRYDPVAKAVVFLDFANARPNRFPTPEESKAHGVNPGESCDISRLSSVLWDLGEEPGEERSYLGASRRRQEFRRWALQMFEGEPWVEWARSQLSVDSQIFPSELLLEDNGCVTLA